MVVKNQKMPPSRSKNVITDIRHFLFHNPEIHTRVLFDNQEKRKEYHHRIMQRIGIDTDKYSILNIHKIGVEAPAIYVFNELLGWNGDSTCWPNHIAKVEREENNIEKIKILPFGWEKYPFRQKKGILGFKFIPLQ